MTLVKRLLALLKRIRYTTLNRLLQTLVILSIKRFRSNLIQLISRSLFLFCLLLTQINTCSSPKKYLIKSKMERFFTFETTGFMILRSYDLQKKERQKFNKISMLESIKRVHTTLRLKKSKSYLKMSDFRQFNVNISTE